MKFLVFSLMLFKFSSASDYNVLIKNDSVNENLVSAVRFIFDKIFLKNQRFLNVMTAAKTPYSNDMQDFKSAIFEQQKSNDLNYVIRLESHTKFQACVRRKCNEKRINNLFIIDSFRSFSTLNRNIKNQSFDVHGQFLLVFPHGRLDDATHENILKILWNKGFYNVNLMYEDNDVVKITTFWPFRDQHCFNTDEITIDIFKNGSFQQNTAADIFPNGKLTENL